MRPILPVLLLLAACGPAAEDKGGGSNQASSASPKEPAPAGRLDRSRAGSAAPATVFEDPDGAPASLADFRGKPLLVNLWATWCAPCIAEMPTLDSLAGREGRRLRVVTVSQDLDGRDKVEAFFAKQRYRHLETWLDPQMALMGDLKVDTLPTTILYDSTGREVWRVVGMEHWDGQRAALLLREGFSPGAAR